MRWLSDENFDGRIVEGLRLRKPSLDITRVQDTLLAGEDDSAVLEFAATENLLVLTHDAKTMISAAVERVDLGRPVQGVFVCTKRLPIADAIDEILTIDECSESAEWRGRIVFLPIR